MKNLKKLREKNGLSQEQLAKILHVSRKTISSWENGRNSISDYYVKKLISIDSSFIDYHKNDSNIFVKKNKSRNFFFFILNFLLLLLCIVNLITSYFGVVIYIEIFLIMYSSLRFNYVIKKFNVSFFIIFLLCLLIQLDKVYISGVVTDISSFFAYFLASIVKSFVITYGFLLTLKFK